jgi:ABC-type oligopeptide transport system substrate-binding subunit
MKRFKLLLVCVSVLALALVIAGCASPEVELATTLNMRLSTDPSTLDPLMMWETGSGPVSGNLFLGLTGIHDITDELTPHLATDWDASDDGLVWTYHLRDDVYWVHYDPQAKAAEKKRKVTAHDVEYGVKRAVDPATGCPYANMDYVIKNAYAVNTGDESASLDSVGVRALDDHTVQFTLEQPAGYFPFIARMPMNRPVPREVIEEFGGAVDGAGQRLDQRALHARHLGAPLSHRTGQEPPLLRCWQGGHRKGDLCHGAGGLDGVPDVSGW